MDTILGRVRRFYGAHPLHLLALLGCFALAGYAALHTATDRAWPWMLAWFLGAVVGHDLVLFPLYALADRSLTSVLHAVRPRRRPAIRPLVPAVNYVRTPALGAGLTFLLFLPGIIRQGAGTYHSATGLTQQPFLGRWLLLCAAMFGASAVVYGIRLGRAGARIRLALRPVRPVIGPGEQVVTLAFASGGAAGAVASTHALYHPTGDQPTQWHRVGWDELADVAWHPAEKTLLVTGRSATNGARLRLRLADPRDLVEAARARIATTGLVRITAEPPGWSRSEGLAGWGALAGLVSGVLVGAVMGAQGMISGFGLLGYAIYAAVVGAVLGAVTGRERRGPAAASSGGVLLGCLGWLAWSLTLVPLLHGHAPTWSAGVAARTYPNLVGDILQGGLTGVLLSVLVVTGLGRSRDRPERAGTAPGRARVVIVGGGFAGVSAAQRFERLAVRGAPVDVTLVSDSNFLLFTPMLAEAAAGAVAATHISAPVRSAVSHTRFRNGTVRHIDTAARSVQLTVGADATETIGYDHLVLAAGSVAHTLGLPGVEEHFWTLKNLADATRLRDHVLGLLERAEQEADPQERGRLLTFVVAGGGFAGTEMIAELFDLVHGVSHFYPGIGPGDARFLLVHAGDRILPEVSAELAGYAQRRLAARGIECRLGARVAEATACRVRLADGEWISARTLVWAAGNWPSPLVTDLARATGNTAVLATDPALRVTGLNRVWAAGDCARIPDPDSGGAPYPPTAQHAIREGRVAADNIAAVLAGRTPVEFRFRAIGILVALGHHTAVADIRGRQFSGLAAWLLWRGIYLAKLPGLEKRIRVLLDWLIDLAFPRDIVVTAPPQRPSTATAPDSETRMR